LVRPDGAVVWVDVWGRTLFKTVGGTSVPIRMVFVYKDITEEVEREKAVADAQRFEALGRLTGGIAHNFNNILTVISGNLQLLRLQPSPSSKHIDEALQASSMGERLIGRLARVARQKELKATRIEVNKLVERLLMVTAPTLGPTIRLERSLDANPDGICVDVPELEAALLNFLMNAKDAMPQGGTVRVSTSNCRYETAVEWTAGRLQPGDYIEIRVSDSGHGMDEITLSRCTETFFTTKPGSGNGLGLATALSFAAQSDGMLSIKSTVDVGTRVSLLLPSGSLN
jgi:two-component system, chemotaxis family, CheB/CheR fusion protein